jgi:hypothetical protein
VILSGEFKIVDVGNAGDPQRKVKGQKLIFHEAPPLRENAVIIFILS